MMKVPSSLRLRIQIWLWRHGNVWPLSMLLAVIAIALLAVETFYIAPLQREAQQSALALQTQLEQNSKLAAQADAPSSMESKEPWTDLRRVLYAEAQIPEVIRNLHASAKKHNISVLSSDFQRQALGKTGIAQQTVIMPFRAPYAQVKLFLFDVLHTHPGVSLDQITIKREAVAQGSPETKVKFSIWVRDASSAEERPPNLEASK